MTGCRFENFPLENVSDLPDLIRKYPQLEGLAVTIPYKKQVLSYLGNREGIPDTLNACNCIRIRNAYLEGFNTDYIGFEKSLLPLLRPHHNKALILVNGGATAAVSYVLERARIPYNIVSRHLHGNSSLAYTDLSHGILNDHTLIINTTPLGMYPHVNECPDIPYEAIGPQHLLYDLVYNPARTVFLVKGEERGATIKNGKEMLELQAEENWKIWNRADS
jgi:shikimate dehydrogenase